MSSAVKVLVTTPRRHTFHFSTITKAAKFLEGKLWNYKEKKWYTLGSIASRILSKRVDEVDGYKFQYQE